MKLEPGSVLLVRFPFSDIVSSKQRPALLLAHVEVSKSIHLYVVSMITSRVDSPDAEGDVVLQDWKEAGLLRPSKLRLAKTATLDDALIRKELGQFTKRDDVAVGKAFRKLYKAWA